MLRSTPSYNLAITSVTIATLAITGCTPANVSNSNEPIKSDELTTSLRASLNLEEHRILSTLIGDVTAESTNGIAGISGEGPFTISLICTGGELVTFAIDESTQTINCDSSITTIDNVQTIALSNGLNIDLVETSTNAGSWAAIVAAVI